MNIFPQPGLIYLIINNYWELYEKYEGISSNLKNSGTLKTNEIK